jgi:SAM-dependent methyltransferase
MDRSVWLKEIRSTLEAQEDLLAPIYDEQWGEIAPLHRQFYDRFLSLCSPQAHILDAACGTGKYWPLILASGRTLLGIDHSQGALKQAREKYPNVSTRKVGLQEMDFNQAFDGATCLDALEMISPEDWPIVVGNLYRAIRPKGWLYFTVEVTARQDIEDSFAEGRQMGLPVIYGETEWLTEGGYHWGQGGCYHYYPEIEQVKSWVQQAGFQLSQDQVEAEYHHFLVRKP